MKKLIKASIVMVSITIVMLSGAKAQTVSSCGKSVNLNINGVKYLLRFNNQAINTAIGGCVLYRIAKPATLLMPCIMTDTVINKGIVIKYNATADLIIALLEKRNNRIK